eukprot:9370279-Alexandrium_andersonii.AAC.1
MPNLLTRRRDTPAGTPEALLRVWGPGGRSPSGKTCEYRYHRHSAYLESKLADLFARRGPDRSW